jgi:DNA-binding beta-propeller fold protein YncE
MFNRRGLLVVTIGLASVLGMVLFAADQRDTLKVGVQADGRIVVPTNQILKPAGQQVTFPGRPVDLALAEEGRVLVIKNNRNLLFLELPNGKVRQTLPLPEVKGKSKFGLSVVGLLVEGNRVWTTDAMDHLHSALRQADGSYKWQAPIKLDPPRVKGEAHPAGIALLADKRLAVTSTRGNSVQIIKPDTGKVDQVVPVGVAPYTIAVLRDDCFYVSNWGGNPPDKDDPQAKTSGTPIRIDPRTGVANHGTISVVERKDGKWQQTATVAVDLHPCALLLSQKRKFLYVANANSDTVTVLETNGNTMVETIRCRPNDRLPFGSGSNALALSRDGSILYVANGTNNCIAVVQLGLTSCEAEGKDPPRRSHLLGLIPTGWYPGAVLFDRTGKMLMVANIKGHGSVSQPRPVAKGKQTYDYLGSVSLIPVPTPAALEEMTAEVNRNNRLAYSLAGLDYPRPDTAAVPLPQRHGEPSLVKHVVYIIKENRTYDQILGDMKEGNGDPALCIFGSEVTPNHHKIAREFVLLDNFYCSGVLSADGHTWCNQAYVTDYLERAFGGFTRSYPDDGTDPLAYASPGFLWDNALTQKKSLRIFGEYIDTEYVPKTASWSDCYKDYLDGKQTVQVKATATIKALTPYTHPAYPWFPLQMPDVARARLFMEELKTWEKKGSMPNLVYLTLPSDHTDGLKPAWPTPRAMVADNDFALGRVVEAISHSKFWKDTCILVVEDDPQNGFDHVDGHRTVALVISPYTRRKVVDSTCYNQTGMVKTIELMLGLQPMNQLDLSATPMRNCFQAEADLTPYSSVPNKIKLNEMNPSLQGMQGDARHWAKKSLEMNFDDGDAADEDTLNRILWFSVKGSKPYPIVPEKEIP